MTMQLSNLIPVLPEIFMLIMICVVLLVDLFLKQSQRDVTYFLAQLTLIGAFIATASIYTSETSSAFSGTFINDALSFILKPAIYIITFSVFLYSKKYLKQRSMYKGEYFVLGLAGVLGMMIMVSGHSFLLLYLGLELLALSLYTMVAFNRDSKQASEAAMKYFVLGALASGMLLYGLSMLYGMSGTLDIVALAQYLKASEEVSMVMQFGLVFVVVGLAFKLGAVPFHMWIPDVYQGAPTCVTLYIGTVTKIAAFALIMRLLVDGLSELHSDWQGMLTIMAVLSLAIGNIVAIAQTNFKRLLAYSAISHVGFILFGILAGTQAGYSAAMFYTLVYALTSAGAFGIILLLSREGYEAEELADLKGLNQRSPWFAAILALLMFSMAGLPPTVGFYAKLFVLQSVINVDMVWLAITAVIFSVIGLFYYLRVVRLMYFDDPVEMGAIEETYDTRLLLSVNGLAVLALGIFPASLMAVCVMAFPA